MGTTWPRTAHLRAARQLAGVLDRLVDAARRPPEVFALDVGRQADQAAHVVAVVLAGHPYRA